MGMMSHPAFGPKAALAYITVGALMDVWTAVWYFAKVRPHPESVTENTWFWLSGLFITGLVLMGIGFFLGQIGRAARKAELPPSEAARAEANIQQTAAAVPNPVVAPGIAAPGMVPGMPAVTAPIVPPVQPAAGS